MGKKRDLWTPDDGNNGVGYPAMIVLAVIFVLLVLFGYWTRSCSGQEVASGHVLAAAVEIGDDP